MAAVVVALRFALHGAFFMTLLPSRVLLLRRRHRALRLDIGALLFRVAVLPLFLALHLARLLFLHALRALGIALLLDELLPLRFALHGLLVEALRLRVAAHVLALR